MTEPHSHQQLPPDDREGQALRTANYMEQHPEGVTLSQIQENCDPSSATKLLSVMRNKLGYRIRKLHTYEACQAGTKRRRRWLFILVARPSTAQQDLFPKT